MVEEIRVNQDGSGSLRFAYGVETSVYPQLEETMPEEYRLENLFSNLIQDDRVTDFSLENYEADGRIWESIELEISNVVELFSEDRRIGPILVSIDENDGAYLFQQTIDMNLSNVAIPGINFLDLSSAEFTLFLHTPQIVNTNGVHRAAGLSDWKISVNDLVEERESLYVQAVYKLEPYEGYFIPWDVVFPMVVFGFLGLGVLSIFLVIYFNTRKNRENNHQLKFDL